MDWLLGVFGVAMGLALLVMFSIMLWLTMEDYRPRRKKERERRAKW